MSGRNRRRTLRVGDIEIDGGAMQLRVRGTLVTTTATEFRLLDYLARHPGRVFSRDQLLDAVWGDARFVTPRSVDVYVRRIREKIEDDAEAPRYLKTMRGAQAIALSAPTASPPLPQRKKPESRHLKCADSGTTSLLPMRSNSWLPLHPGTARRRCGDLRSHGGGAAVWCCALPASFSPCLPLPCWRAVSARHEAAALTHYVAMSPMLPAERPLVSRALAPAVLATAQAAGDVTRRLTDLQESRHQMEVLLEGMGDAVLGVDAAGRVQWSNARMQRLIHRDAPGSSVRHGRALVQHLPRSRAAGVGAIDPGSRNGIAVPQRSPAARPHFPGKRIAAAGWGSRRRAARPHGGGAG